MKITFEIVTNTDIPRKPFCLSEDEFNEVRQVLIAKLEDLTKEDGFAIQKLHSVLRTEGAGGSLHGEIQYPLMDGMTIITKVTL